MYIYTQDEYLMVKTTPTPNVVDNDNNHYVAPLQIPQPRAKQRRRQPPLGAWMSPARDQREAVAEAIAFPLEVQSGINRH
jgi:hypothetical protein